MNQQVEILKQDIEKLFAKMVEERNPMVEQYARKKCAIVWDEPNGCIDTTKTKDYRQYRKLFDTLRSLIQMMFYKDRDFYNNILNKIKKEMDIIHSLADESLDGNRFDQYRCLMDIYLSGQKMMPLENNFNAYNHYHEK